MLETRGDTNNVNDAPIKEEQVIGKVVFKIPYIGFIKALIQENLIQVLAVAAAIFISILFIKLYKGGVKND